MEKKKVERWRLIFVAAILAAFGANQRSVACIFLDLFVLVGEPTTLKLRGSLCSYRELEFEAWLKVVIIIRL